MKDVNIFVKKRKKQGDNMVVSNKNFSLKIKKLAG